MSVSVRAVLQARSFRWGVNTVASFIVNLGLTIGLHEGFGVRPELAYAAALVTVFLMNFVFFRYYVFVREEPIPIGRQFLAYSGSAVGFRLAEYLFFVLIHSVAGVHYIATVILVQGISFVVKYFFYDRVIFRARQRD